MTELAVTTRPVFRIDGQVRGELARDLDSLLVEETTAGLKHMRVRLVAQGPADAGDPLVESQLYLDGALVDFGQRIEVILGSEGETRVVFLGQITAIEAEFGETSEPHVTLFAEDRLMDLRMVRRARSYKDVSDADIAREIAGFHGLQAEVDADGPVHELVHQYHMSDLAFLRERARAISAEIWVDDATLYFQSRASRSAAQVEPLVQGNQLIAIKVRADLAHQRTAVHVRGWDAQAAESIDERAGEDIVAAQAGPGLTGPALLERALGTRALVRVRDVPHNQAQAQAWAQGEMLRRARCFVVAAGVTQGTPDMVVGSRLTLQNIGTPFSGEGWYATTVCHAYDHTQGLRTHFEAERSVLTRH